MKRLILRYQFIISILTGLIVGLFVCSQGWAGIYLAYSPGSEMMIVSGSNSLSGVTEALRNYQGYRIVFYSDAGLQAESTIRSYQAGDIGLGPNLVSNPDFGAGVTDWTAVGSAVLNSVAGGELGNCIKVQFDGVPTVGALASQNVTVTAGKFYKCSAYFKKGDAPNGYIYFYYNGISFSRIFAPLTDAAWVQYSDILTNMMATLTVYLGACYTENTADIYSYHDTVSVQEVTAPGGNGCGLGTVIMQNGFDPNKITKFQIFAPVPQREQRRNRIGPWRMVYDSGVN
jgi:hypothetical protein